MIQCLSYSIRIRGGGHWVKFVLFKIGTFSWPFLGLGIAHSHTSIRWCEEICLCLFYFTIQASLTNLNSMIFSKLKTKNNNIDCTNFLYTTKAPLFPLRGNVGQLRKGKRVLCWSINIISLWRTCYPCPDLSALAPAWARVDQHQQGRLTHQQQVLRVPPLQMYKQSRLHFCGVVDPVPDTSRMLGSYGVYVDTRPKKGSRGRAA